jgi:hypothetical protein
MLPGDFVTETDPSGSYSITELRPGKYTIKLTLVFAGDYAIHGKSTVRFAFPEAGAPWGSIQGQSFSASGDVAPVFFVFSSAFEVGAGDAVKLDLGCIVR